MITPSAPGRAGWTAAAHCAGVPVAVGASHSLGNQRRDVLELLGRGDGVDRASERRHHLVGAEALEHRGIPAVGLGPAGRRSPGGRWPAARRSSSAADPRRCGRRRREARPDRDGAGIAPACSAPSVDRARRSVVSVSSVKKVWRTTVDRTPARRARATFGPKATSSSGMSSSNVGSSRRYG